MFAHRNGLRSCCWPFGRLHDGKSSPRRADFRGGGREGGRTRRRNGHGNGQRRGDLLPRHRPASGACDPVAWVSRNRRHVCAGGGRAGQTLSADCAGSARRRPVAAHPVGLREEDARDRRQGADGPSQDRSRPCHRPRHRRACRLCLCRPVSRAIAESHGGRGVHRGSRGHRRIQTGSHRPIRGRSISRASRGSTKPWPSIRARRKS